eukprot:SAG11_NODE_3651_length_2310_cov_1.335142_4_plen_267_part_00
MSVRKCSVCGVAGHTRRSLSCSAKRICPGQRTQSNKKQSSFQEPEWMGRVEGREYAINAGASSSSNVRSEVVGPSSSSHTGPSSSSHAVAPISQPAALPLPPCYQLAGGFPYTRRAWEHNDLGNRDRHAPLSFHLNAGYCKDEDVPTSWLRSVHAFCIEHNADMVNCVLERAKDGTTGAKVYFSLKRKRAGQNVHKLHLHCMMTWPMPNNPVAIRIVKEMLRNMLNVSAGEVKMSLKALEDGVNHDVLPIHGENKSIQTTSYQSCF